MKPGKVRLKLAEMLRAKGFDVQAEDLWIQLGGYRHRNWDLARWGHYPTGVHSWDTMTDCVRYGFDVGKDNELSANVPQEAWSKRSAKRKAEAEARLEAERRARAAERSRRDARRERFKVYRCSCGLQFPHDGGPLACWHCGGVETLTDVTSDLF